VMKYLLDLVLWEDLLHSFRGERIQDYFNKEMLDCDIVFALFHTKVGQFTKEDLWLRMLSFIYSMSDHHEKGKEYHEEVLIP